MSKKTAGELAMNESGEFVGREIHAQGRFQCVGLTREDGRGTPIYRTTLRSGGNKTIEIEDGSAFPPPFEFGKWYDLYFKPVELGDP